MKNPIPLKKHIHFIGIGGIGVSALARYFLSENNKISGSDACHSEITDQLKKEGMEIFIGHKQSNVSKNADLIIYSAAVKKDNFEIIKAEKLGIPFESYAEALGELTSRYKTIAVSGSHGKSTTTAMLSLALIKAGLDPTVIIGTKLKEFAPPASGKNFHGGKGNLLVVEADEYHKSFLNYSPFAAVITNIDREHLDYYKNLAEIKNVFLKFIKNIQPDGILVSNKDDKNLFGLKNEIQKIAEKNKLKVFWYSLNNNKIADKLSSFLKVPGKHNVSNALAAYTLSKTLGVKDGAILKALGEYRGAWRRMEYKGQFSIPNFQFPIKVYDDYAHHPTEIKATLAGIRSKWPKSAIICVFQPHQEKRLKALFKEFVSAFNDANALVLLDIYKVKGRDEVLQNVDSEKLVKAIKKRKQSPFVIFLKNPNNLKKEIKNILKTKSLKLKAIVVMMGAGDIYKMTDKLIE